MVRLMITRVCALTVLACALAPAQKFEVASVKPANPEDPTGRMVGKLSPIGGPGTADPSRIHYPATTLKYLLQKAYDVHPPNRIVGPDWLGIPLFEIDATMPATTTDAEFQAMLRNLLADRFQLKVHRETKAVPTYTLSVAGGRPKVKKSADAPPPQASDGNLTSTQRLATGPEGYLIPPKGPGTFVQNAGARARMTSQQGTMQDMAAHISTWLRGTVTDATGLTGGYDYVLTFMTYGLEMDGEVVAVSPRAPGGPGVQVGRYFRCPARTARPQA